MKGNQIYMILHKNYYKINETEAIILTITLGEDGSEFEKKCWKERGCLRGNYFNSFEKKLKCYFDKVIVEGKGKKRVYTLLGLLPEPIAKIDNRKGRVLKEMPQLMPFVLKKLDEIAGEEVLETTLNQLCKKVDFIPYANNLKRDFYIEIYSLLKDTSIPTDKIKSIAQLLWETFESNLTTTLKNTLEALKSEGYILIQEVYKARDVNDEDFYTMTDKQVEKLIRLEQSIVKANKLYYGKYKSYYALPKVPDKIIRLRKVVSSEVKKQLNIEKYYKALQIMIIDSDLAKDSLSDGEISKICLNRFSRLVTDKVKKQTYVSGLSYAKKFHYMALLCFMKTMNPEDSYDKLIEDELRLIDKKVIEIKEYYRDYYKKLPDEYTLLKAEYEAELVAEMTDEKYELFVEGLFKKEPMPEGFVHNFENSNDNLEFAHQ